MKILKVLFLIFALLSFFSGRFATLLDKRVFNNEIPKDSNILVYFVKQFLLTLIAYKILIPTQNFKRWEVKNKNELIAVKTIRLMYALSISSLLCLLLVLILLICNN